jgi:uncharacterized membrane protein
MKKDSWFSNDISISKKVRQYFLAGLLVLTPVVLTMYVVWQLFFWIDGLLNEYITRAIFRGLKISPPFDSIPGLGLLALLILILFVGFVARNYFGRQFINIGEQILQKIPVVKQIYSAFQQISQAFLSDKSEVFKKAALFEYPRKGIYCIGFITQDTKGIIQETIGQKEDVYSIFLPTTPNPTSGFLLFLPKKDVTVLNISVEEALKLVISGGAIVPQTINGLEQNNGPFLLDEKIEPEK